jgi:hypothetical protein
MRTARTVATWTGVGAIDKGVSWRQAVAQNASEAATSAAGMRLLVETQGIRLLFSKSLLKFRRSV